MVLISKNNNVAFTQAITKASKIKFMQTLARFREVAVRHDLNSPRSGLMLDTLIEKFCDQLTNEDFFPNLYNGNELKEQD